VNESSDSASAGWRPIRFTLLLVASWVTMTTTHEFGHLVGGWIGGATLRDYTLAPWRLPYSVHSPDPHPLLTLWGGPLLGTLVPLSVAASLRDARIWFVADFCLLANGSYLALASVAGNQNLDTPRLLAAGGHPATIILYCTITIGIGYVRFRSDCARWLIR
jgi:hypothetical protein